MELPANGDAAHSVADDVIVKALESIEDSLQKVLILLFLLSYIHVCMYVLVYVWSYLHMWCKGSKRVAFRFLDSELEAQIGERGLRVCNSSI